MDFDGENFTAVGTAGVIFTSKTGTDWTQQTSPTANDLFSVASSRGIRVAVGLAGTAIHSPDGLNWTVQSSGSSTDLNGVTSGKIYQFLPLINN